MSITPETAEQHKMDYAVVCCRTEAGKIITAGDLEDPAILPDLEDSGLLTIPDNCLKIGEVLDAKLTATIDSLTPITPDIVEGANAIETPVEEIEEEEEVVKTPKKSATTAGNAGIFKLHIGKGEDIDLEIPLGVGTNGVASQTVTDTIEVKADKTTEEKQEAKKVRELIKKHYKIDKVEFGPETKIDGTTLYIRENVCDDAVEVNDLVKSIKIDIITKDEYNKYSETIMDVQPIATKEGEDKLGTGVTRVLDGVVMMVTGTDEGGVQIGEFGSSEGILEQNIMWNRPGSPDKGDIFIKTEVVIQEHTNMERRGPLAAHTATDFITQEIRDALKNVEDESLVVDEELIEQYKRPGKKKVVIVKEIMGQGAMHDNLILPVEPVGVLGGKPNVDLGNVPIMLSPLEVLDGGIHALTCIGPASKETSRHYWREPLVLEAMNDPEVDLCGVLFVGSPQINSEKFYVSERLGMIVEALGVDGAFVTTEGFGNNHIDFASHIEQIGMRDIPVVGMSFCAVQGALVVGNEHMKYMIDLNKSKDGIENEVLSCNVLCPEDAIRAMAMLKAAMEGEEVKDAERNWNPNVKENNLDLIEKEYGVKVERVQNEQSLPMSEKRKEKYS
ncbi:D-proline reductase (dithiol) proprotein PrdA [Schnuerera sp. xch1]|uniref:D-proline reductase (dithiol) proprotein PrdA n=1 Tax=Schnuerera sp. xch1 TaxID=2874283 RepID=UPI001CBE653C|nr:D-proline reductase (dithiol) proprotein PrdA [Schnuerera sp. xch1]MBZ2174989.1 D-proline reductase (dithiol) proprotein PrdA [Schnuerera sp. xch1]